MDVERVLFRYPVFIDAAAQSLGVGFVGTRGSTMSLMAGRRVMSWSGGVMRDINGAPDATDKRRSLHSAENDVVVDEKDYITGYEFVV